MQPVADDGGGARQIAVAEKAGFAAQQVEGIPQNLAALAQPESFAGDRLAGVSQPVEMARQRGGQIIEEWGQNGGDV